jgi:DNA-binding CsgD family transcriptional regulator
MNQHARQLMAREDGGLLEQTILELFATGGHDGKTIRFERQETGSTYLLWSTPLLNGAPYASYRAVVIFDTSKRHEVDRELLTSVFRFTKAELRLAEQLLAGRTPAEAAETLQVTIHTVRTYLKRLYHKAGVRTQATLVRALLQAVEPVSNIARSQGSS